MDEENKDSKFTIKDNRASLKSDDEAKADDEKKKEAEAKAQAKEEAKNKEKKSGTPASEFEMNFSTFVMSLTSSAFYYLGDVPDPQTGEMHENLPAVKQTIDILLILQDKTKNNLSDDEDKLLEQLIYELQTKYVAKKK